MYAKFLILVSFLVLMPSLHAQPPRICQPPMGQMEQLNQQIALVTQFLMTLTNAHNIKQVGIGTLGALSAYQGLMFLREGFYRAINDTHDQVHAAQQWWTPERKKGALLCASGAAWIAAGSYFMLKPNHIVHCFCRA